ncbi:putative methyltransferase [Trypanosoma cruzi]|uniref:Ribosomal RNA-processing protein 8 n=1 Tax=Trypanosoma cruzi TaxID=5693 RepID=A0A2V2VFT9_TRYCR|nr:Ribosomal RNA-processing protein 8 (RRP8) [Trypanosoma cruzi cruzi]PWU95395.1 putative ribosomal RNA-processing protein 8 [Trypanosoma cruzi]RNF17696.1 putative methyltransferase [Trypanosoma cruzi]
MFGGSKGRKGGKHVRSAKKETSAASTERHPKKVHRISTDPKKKSHNGSTLKGPVVSNSGGNASRDFANDRQQIPFKNKLEERAYKKANRIPLYAPASGGKKGDGDATAKRSSGASSAAQRRAIMKAKGDDAVLEHFRTKLSSSTFRLLNEQIYNSPVAFASQLLRDPSTYADYHNGYRQQLEQWPLKPSQVVVDALLGDRRGRFLANKAKSMPGYIPTSWVIADMGCGDAQIAQAMRPKGYTVHSFDFCAVNDYVTVANTTSVPLDNNTVDICIFSLSLMSTDYVECLYEAFRVLKPKRLLKIIEVRSRVPHPKRFSELVESIGFYLDYYDTVGKYFVAYDFIKREDQAKANRGVKYDPREVLVASLYKKR